MCSYLDARHCGEPGGASPPSGIVRAELGRLAPALLGWFFCPYQGGAMAKTVIGIFDNLGAAQAALRELGGSGIAEHDIGFMADQQHEVPSTGLFRFGKDRMDKRKAWRAQEQALIERWNATATRQRELQAEITRQSDAGGAPSAQLLLDAERSRSEMETVRREVARMKVQF